MADDRPATTRASPRRLVDDLARIMITAYSTTSSHMPGTPHERLAVPNAKDKVTVIVRHER
ncbi:hypothetical protein [Saccharothrix sp. Mg75]|uniref:hypothetical protein n=1 Tax=Saccharothrix sp. Mg75 TaxID=3445357 RepID=UPI003EEB7C5B